MNTLFSRFGLLAVLLTFLLPVNTSAQYLETLTDGTSRSVSGNVSNEESLNGVLISSFVKGYTLSGTLEGTYSGTYNGIFNGGYTGGISGTITAEVIEDERLYDNISVFGIDAKILEGTLMGDTTLSLLESCLGLGNKIIDWLGDSLVPNAKKSQPRQPDKIVGDIVAKATGDIKGEMSGNASGTIIGDITGSITALEHGLYRNGHNGNIGEAFVTGYGTFGGTLYEARLVNEGTIGTAVVGAYGFLDNYGSIESFENGKGQFFDGVAVVNDRGVLTNREFGYIENAIVNDGGRLTNLAGSPNQGASSAGIDSVFVNAGGILDNQSFGRIEFALLDGGTAYNEANASMENLILLNGTVINYGNSTGKGTIGTAILDGGTVDNNGGVIETAVVLDGRVNNNASITEANVSGGTVWNRNNASITMANVSGGELYNGWPYYENYEDTASITTANVSGGTVGNIGTINNLTYTSGTYNGRRVKHSNGWFLSGNGTIGTLTLAGDSANNTGDWGIIENLVFHENGNGILHISAFANMPGTQEVSGIQAASIDAAPMSFNSLLGITFSSAIQPTQSVDFTYGNIVLDLLGFGYGDDLVGSFLNAFGFDGGFNLLGLLDTMFGSVTVTGDIDELSLQVAFSGTASFWLVNNGTFGDDWSYNDDTGFVTYGIGTGGGGDSSVPEPATLVMLGLGFVGLGLARRRRK